MSHVTPSATVDRPDHVPADLVRDVDFFTLACPGADVQEGWWHMQQANPDFFWTPHNGGHWVVTRADLIEKVVSDYEHFSNKHIMIPKEHHETRGMLEIDPPEHAPLRKMIQPELAKVVLDRLEDKAREAAIAALDAIAPRGECEFFSEFAQVLPITVFLDLMGLPQEDRHFLLPLVEAVVCGNDVDKRMAARMQLAGYIQGWIERRRAEPGSDLVSKLAHAKIGDRPITPAETVSMGVLLLFGGLDTVAAMISFIARDLALRPELRKRLIDDPSVIPAATEEFLRRHGLVNQARVITKDCTFEGVALKAGEMIQAPSCLHGLDDRRHADPLTIDFDRPQPIRHGTFGGGPHICAGAILARREIKVFLEEWLKRIPDFTIKAGTEPVTVSGSVNGVEKLYLSWEPRG